MNAVGTGSRLIDENIFYLRRFLSSLPLLSFSSRDAHNMCRKQNGLCCVFKETVFFCFFSCLEGFNCGSHSHYMACFLACVLACFACALFSFSVSQNERGLMLGKEEEEKGSEKQG